ncbi:hypothetical protein ACP275_07G088500 [Erythranthe tilingii]
MKSGMGIRCWTSSNSEVSTPEIEHEHNPSSGELLRLLRAKFSESNSPTADEEGDNVEEKPRCRMNWPLICCGSENEVNVSPPPPPPSPTKSTSSIPSVVHDLKSEPIFFGRSHEKKHLLSHLLSPNKRPAARFSTISILGIGGIGKTTLTRQVYEDKTVKNHFEVTSWVKPTSSVDLPGMAREIINSATGISCPLDDLEQLDVMVRDSFLSQRTLIVLDEIEHMNKDTWLHMKDSWFNTLGLGSKIVITTTSKQVADIASDEVFELAGGLSKDASLSLYNFWAAGDRPTAERVAALCQGVPLSLKLLGSLVRFEENLSRSFDTTMLLSSRLDISNVLYLSVLALPRDLLLCFIYCAIFPRGEALRRKKLIELWMAEGFINQSSTGTKGFKYTGDDCFNQLLCRSFFTDITCDEYGEVVQVRMHGVIHQFAQEIARIVFRRKVGVVVDVDMNSEGISMVLPFGGQHDHARNLQTLIISPCVELSGAVLSRSLVEFKRLRSLDLSCSGIRKLSSRISVLRKLRYLNLSHTLVRKLPSSLTRLAYLQTLDLTSCYYLKVLPEKMSKLTQLRQLDLSQCNSLSYFPCGIGLLTSLKSMPLFVLDQSHGAGLRELQKLSDLGGELQIQNLENVKETSEATDAELKKKKRIHHLGLSWGHNVDECYRVLECLEPSPTLRVLDLMGYGAYGFPSWIPKIEGLVKISITDCRCVKLPTLGQLPFLKEILLKGLAEVRSIGQEFYGHDSSDVFPSLEQLKLYDMPKLYRWSSRPTFAAGSSGVFLPRLKTLTIAGCHKLKRLPPLPSVTDLVVWKSNSKILASLTSIRSLLSLVVNDMEMRESFVGSKGSSLVKKLIIVRGRDLYEIISNNHLNQFAFLNHMVIQHCLKLKTVSLFGLGSLRKLNIVGCENLSLVQLPTETTELVIEDCPKIETFGENAYLSNCLRKLIIRNCLLLGVLPSGKEGLRALEYLLVSRCPRLERRLEEEREKISHVPCIIIGDGALFGTKTFDDSKI